MAQDQQHTYSVSLNVQPRAEQRLELPCDSPVFEGYESSGWW